MRTSPRFEQPLNRLESHRESLEIGLRQTENLPEIEREVKKGLKTMASAL